MILSNESFFIVYVIFGVLWNIRNKMCIEKTFLGSSNEVFYKFFHCYRDVLSC
jgi:hypothetical protein